MPTTMPLAAASSITFANMKSVWFELFIASFSFIRLGGGQLLFGHAQMERMTFSMVLPLSAENSHRQTNKCNNRKFATNKNKLIFHVRAYSCPKTPWFHLKCSWKLWSQSDDAHIFQTYLTHAIIDNPIFAKDYCPGTMVRSVKRQSEKKTNYSGGSIVHTF